MSDWTSILQEQKKPSHETSTIDNMQLQAINH